MARSTASRRKTKELEREIRAHERANYRSKAKLEKLRHRLPPVEVTDYVFGGHDGKPLRLSEAFGEKTDLLVIHNMGTRCPMCTMWADGVNGLRHHLEDRAALLVTSTDPVRVQKAFAKKREWRFRMASAAGTLFVSDMGYEDREGRPWPGVSAFHRAADGRLFRVGTASFGPGDDFCPTFAFVGLLKDGQNDWWPKFTYPKRGRGGR
jgi:predicted dithiol-disulfide oxidoreductase (DUF899 family)